MKAFRTPRSLLDIVEIADYLAENDVEIAERFFKAVDETVERIRKSPKVGSVRQSKKNGLIRMWFIKDFENVLVFYREDRSEIIIIRLIHSSRDYTRLI